MWDKIITYHNSSSVCGRGWEADYLASCSRLLGQCWGWLPRHDHSSLGLGRLHCHQCATTNSGWRSRRGSNPRRNRNGATRNHCWYCTHSHASATLRRGGEKKDYFIFCYSNLISYSLFQDLGLYAELLVSQAPSTKR